MTSEASQPAEHLRWAKGGTALFLSLEGEAVVLRSSIPSPPGSRLEATFTAAPAGPVKVKVHGSKREDDGSYTIRGRLIDATREVRERVAGLTQAG